MGHNGPSGAAGTNSITLHKININNHLLPCRATRRNKKQSMAKSWFNTISINCFRFPPCFHLHRYLAEGCCDGGDVGILEGASEERSVGAIDGAKVGFLVGFNEGASEGKSVGVIDGTKEVFVVGWVVGSGVGLAEGVIVGLIVGLSVVEISSFGAIVGLAPSNSDGDCVGGNVGENVGGNVGSDPDTDGDCVGANVGSDPDNSTSYGVGASVDNVGDAVGALVGPFPLGSDVDSFGALSFFIEMIRPVASGTTITAMVASRYRTLRQLTTTPRLGDSSIGNASTIGAFGDGSTTLASTNIPSWRSLLSGTSPS
jgi:hypothetical protein